MSKFLLQKSVKYFFNIFSFDEVIEISLGDFFLPHPVYAGNAGNGGPKFIFAPDFLEIDTKSVE